MNVRHNNCDPTNSGYYNKEIATLEPQKLEEWYDLIYEQALTLFVLLNQTERTKKIKELKVQLHG